MKILVTGAAGYLGTKLATRLAGMGHHVHALVRQQACPELLHHPNVTIYQGDILRADSLRAAMRGCEQVYHTAARVGAWAREPAEFYEVNVEGTRQVLRTAQHCGVAQTVCTSTCGVLGPTSGAPLPEQHVRTIPFTIDYDRSKKMGEDVALEYARAGQHVVVVRPAKVYGPGSSSHSLTANAILHTFLTKGVAFVPFPGTYEVCFAYSEDVVAGHLLAMARGVSGEAYNLGGINISYGDFFRRFRALASGRGRILPAPKGVLRALAYAQELNYKLTGAPIRFPVSSINHFFSNYTFSSDKATQDLGYAITPLEEALRQTIHFLRTPAHG